LILAMSWAKVLSIKIVYSFQFFVAWRHALEFLLQFLECIHAYSFFPAKVSFLGERRGWVLLLLLLLLASWRVDFLLILDSKWLICHLILTKTNQCLISHINNNKKNKYYPVSFIKYLKILVIVVASSVVIVICSIFAAETIENSTSAEVLS